MAESSLFEHYLEQELNRMGYVVKYQMKVNREDGCIMAYKGDMFTLDTYIPVQFSSKAREQINGPLPEGFDTMAHVAQIFKLKFNSNGNFICGINTHLAVDKNKRIFQINCLMNEMASFMNNQDLPTVICGDFNFTPFSDEYDFVRMKEKKKVIFKNVHREAGIQPNSYWKHGFSSLESAYTCFGSSNLPHVQQHRQYLIAGEAGFTQYSSGNTYDYIFFTEEKLECKRLLGLFDYDTVKAKNGFPNINHPSDHIPILASFYLKQHDASCTGAALPRSKGKGIMILP